MIFLQFFYQAMEIINPTRWKHYEMFEYDAKSRSLFCKYKSTEFLDGDIETLINDPFIHRQLEEQNVDVDSLQSEWISLKKILSRWDKKEFSSDSYENGDTSKLYWCTIGRKVSGHGYLFALVDYFLSQNVSEAEAERGFCVVKETKTARRAILSNKYLENQLRIILSDTAIKHLQLR